MFSDVSGKRFFYLPLLIVLVLLQLQLTGCSETGVSETQEVDSKPDEEIFTVKTIAGNSIGYIDDVIGKAKFNNPWGIALNSRNEIYIGDSDNAVIRLVTRDETVETFAGRGYGTGYLDGPWDEALFAQPMGLELGLNGVLYIADASNHAIRTVSRNGLVETYAGVGLSGRTDGPRLQARFSSPADIAVSSNLTIYVADGQNYKIRKIDIDGIVSTLTGTGSQGFRDGAPDEAQFALPVSIALGPAEEYLYVADFFNHRIRKIEIASGRVSTVAGNGEAGFTDGNLQDARLNRPAGIDVSADGTIYFSDSGNHVIRMIRNEEVTTIAGDGSPGTLDAVGEEAGFDRPYHVVLSRVDTFLYVSDWGNHLVRRIRLRI